MTWKRVALYWACFVTLAVYDTLSRRDSRSASEPPPVVRLIPWSVDEVTAIEVRRGRQMLSFQRRADGGWRSDGASRVSSDLVGALVGVLASERAVEIVAAAATADSTFGLASPYSRIRLSGSNGRQLGVATGATNPAGTSVYARVEDDPRVFLIGLDVRYYEDLLFSTSGSEQTGRQD